MAITGITGFKCIRWQNSKWVSPAKKSFTWDSSVVWASCRVCPLDDEGHIIISEVHSCGIYATLRDDELLDYMRDEFAVALLLEALGHGVNITVSGQRHSQIWAHTHGFTASGVLVVGVINLSKFGQEFRPFEYQTIREGKQQLVMKMASNFFKAPIMDYQTARIITQKTWTKEGLEWPMEIPKL